MLTYLIWHYSSGIQGFLKIWGNYLAFFAHYFSLGLLLKTLISPWHRDVTLTNWRGFHPLLTLQKFVNNIFSRFMGMLVRIFVIIFALIIEILTLLFGIVIFIGWLFVPLFFVFFVYSLISNLSLNVIQLLYSLFGLIILVILEITVIRAFFFSQKKSPADMTLEELASQDWFVRVWNRMGFNQENAEIRQTFFDPDKFSQALNAIGMKKEDFDQIINWEFRRLKKLERKRKFWERANLFARIPIGIYWAFGYTVELDKFSWDLQNNFRVVNNDSRLIGHEKDLEMLELILSRSSQSNALIVGEPGVGKKTLIYHLAKLIHDQAAGDYLNQKRLVELDLEALISKVNRQDLEYVLNKVFYQAAYAGNVILVVQDIDEFLRPEEGKLEVNISEILIKYLEVPTFQMIGTLSKEAFHEHIERNQSVMKYTDKIILEALNKEEALLALINFLELSEKNKVLVTHQALKKIVELSDQYMAEVPLPESAFDALEVIIGWIGTGKDPLKSEHVEEFFARKFKVPVGKVSSAEKNRLMQLEEILHQRVIGQHEAIREISESMRRVRAGISDRKKPVGSFLFLGPTGVGKTETAKALAEAYFGDENRMIRMDMSEFQAADSIGRFLGSREMNQPSQLISKVKENPFSVLLLDEIEKAYPEILDLFLQVLDEGWLTDVFGKKASFQNMIIIATSNAGAGLIKEGIEKNTPKEELYKQVIDFIINQSIFRPEFLNRFEKIILFESLKDQELLSATRLIADNMAQRIYQNKNIKISFSNDFIANLIKIGYDPIFGMRSMKRFAQDKIEDAVAKKLITGEWKSGGEFEFTSEDLQ